MEFRFLPRQMGLFGKKGEKRKGGKIERYEEKNLVTPGEVAHVKNSTVTPYRRKASKADPVIKPRLEDGVRELVANKAVTPYRHKPKTAPVPQATPERKQAGYGLVNNYGDPTPYNRTTSGGTVIKDRPFKDTFVDMVRDMGFTPHLRDLSSAELVSEQPHDSHISGIQERVTAQAARERVTDMQIRQNAAAMAARVDANTPAEYMHQPKTGFLGKISDMLNLSGGRNKREDDRGTQSSAVRETFPNNDALGTDADGKILFRDDIVAMIQNEMQRRREERLPLELQWQLNGNFYNGNQYCDINPVCNEIRQYPRCFDWEQHEVFNRIAPLVETRVANLKKINYAMTVKPSTNETDDYQKAKVSTAVLQHIQQQSGFNSKKDALILWNELCGSCFMMTWWDAYKGDVVADINESFADENGFAAAKASPNGDAFKHRRIYTGDIDYGLLTPYEVYPESIFKQTVADQGSIIIEQVKSIDEIENLYGIRVEPTEIDSFTLTPVPAAGGLGYEATVLSMGKAKIRNCQKVTTYFERRSKAYPDGRMAIVVGETELVYYGAMPYDDIPIIRTVCKEKAGQFFGKSVIEELIPLQRAYNSVSNDVNEWIKRLKSPQHMVMEGSVDIDEYEEHANEPGAILVYRNQAPPPRTDQTVSFSGEVFTQKHDLERQMEYVAAVSQLMVFGQLPSGVTSGVAIENLRDIDNTRLALTGDYIRNAVIEMSRLWLSMYKRYANSYRIIRCTGTNEIGNVVVWSREDITSYDIHFKTENELMFSEDAQWQRIMGILSSGISDQKLHEEVIEKVREYIRAGSYNSELTINELQTQAAVRENALLTANVLPAVREYDNHKIHADEHLRYILQMEFEIMRDENPELCNVMVAHYMEHMAVMEQKAMRRMQMGGAA